MDQVRAVEVSVGDVLFDETTLDKIGMVSRVGRQEAGGIVLRFEGDRELSFSPDQLVTVHRPRAEAVATAQIRPTRSTPDWAPVVLLLLAAFLGAWGFFLLLKTNKVYYGTSPSDWSECRMITSVFEDSEAPSLPSALEDAPSDPALMTDAELQAALPFIQALEQASCAEHAKDNVMKPVALLGASAVLALVVGWVRRRPSNT